MAVAVTPVLGRLALVVPHGGVVRLKRDIAPLSTTQLVALLREAGRLVPTAAEGWRVAQRVGAQ